MLSHELSKLFPFKCLTTIPFSNILSPNFLYACNLCIATSVISLTMFLFLYLILSYFILLPHLYGFIFSPDGEITSPFFKTV